MPIFKNIYKGYHYSNIAIGNGYVKNPGNFCTNIGENNIGCEPKSIQFYGTIIYTPDFI